MRDVNALLAERAGHLGLDYLVGPEIRKGVKLILNKEGNPIRILMVAAHTCIRVIKEATALMKRGYVVDILTGKLSFGIENFDRVYYWDSQNPVVGIRQLKSMLPVLKDSYDLYVWHNEPDFPVRMMYEAGIFPIIVDAHDLDSVRQNMLTIDEVDMFKYANGVVHVSKPVHDWANKIHNYTKPTTILYSFCNNNVVSYNEEIDSHRRGIVYEGGANPPSDASGFGESFRYRSLYPICKKVVEMGNDLTMYIGNSDALISYSDFGATILPPTDYLEMMRGMTKFKWGLVCFNNADGTQRQTNMTLTNKMFESIMAGLPVIVFGAHETARVVNELGVGIVLENLEDLGNVEENYGHLYPQLKCNVDRVRKDLVMEKNIWKLENLYREVIEIKNS